MHAECLTHCYDNLRTSWNRHEKILDKRRVANAFGLQWTYMVDGQVFGQPLYVTEAVRSHSHKRHNAVFVVTETNWVYAFDATQNHKLWERQLLAPGERLVDAAGDLGGCGNIAPKVGITSTPCVNRPLSRLYVCTKSVEANGNFHHWLYALNLQDGTDAVPRADIAATVAVAGQPVTFVPQWQLQRPGLLLMDDVVYIGFGSHCDFHGELYHGWVFAYDARTLHQRGVIATSGPGNATSVWQSGRGLAGAQEAVYFETGNGAFDGAANFGSSVLKIRLVSNTLKIVDFFTPCDQSYLNGPADQDLGSGGPLLLPFRDKRERHLLAAAGKTGTVYLLDRNKLGGYTAPPPGWQADQQCTDNAVGVLWRVLGGIAGGPACFGGDDGERRLYFFPSSRSSGAPTQAVAIDLNNFQGGVMQSTVDQPYSSGGTPCVSSDGDEIDSAVLWIMERVPGRTTLVAFDAANISTTLCRLQGATTVVNEGSSGAALVAGPPTVADGRVYVSGDGGVDVFG